MLFMFSKAYLDVLVSRFRVSDSPFFDSFPAFPLVPARFFLGLRDIRSTIRSPNKPL